MRPVHRREEGPATKTKDTRYTDDGIGKWHPVMADWKDEETEDSSRADERNFYKLEKWTKDGTKIDRLIYAGNNLDKARDLFAKAIKHRPKIRLTIRQRTRVLNQHP